MINFLLTSPDSIPDGYASGIDTEKLYIPMIVFLAITTFLLLVYILILNNKIDNLKEKLDEVSRNNNSN